MGSTCTKGKSQRVKTPGTNSRAEAYKILDEVENSKSKNTINLEENPDINVDQEEETIVFKEQIKQENQSSLSQQFQPFLKTRKQTNESGVMVISNIEIVKQQKEEKNEIKDLENIESVYSDHTMIAKEKVIEQIRNQGSIPNKMKEELIRNLDNISEQQYQNQMAKSKLSSYANSLQDSAIIQSQAEIQDLTIENLEFSDIQNQTDKFWGVLNQIGRGTQGSVQKIFDPNQHCNFALKQFRDEQNYIYEKKINKKLQQLFPDNQLSEIAVELHSYDDKQQQLVFVFGLMSLQEFAECKQNLKQKISEEEFWYIMITLVSHLKALHTKKIYHSDIKPGNILLFLQDSKYHLKLGDFGVSTENYQEVVGYTHRYFPIKEFLSVGEREKADYYGVGKVCQEMMIKQLYFNCSGNSNVNHESEADAMMKELNSHSEKSIADMVDLLRINYSDELTDAVEQLLLQKEFTFLSKKKVNALSDNKNQIFNYLKKERQISLQSQLLGRSSLDLVHELKLCLQELQCYDQAKEIAKALEAKGLQDIQKNVLRSEFEFCELLMQIAVAYQFTSNYEIAIQYLKQCLTQFEKQGPENQSKPIAKEEKCLRFLADVHFNLGQSFNSVENHQDAETHLKKSLEIEAHLRLILSKSSQHCFESHKTYSELGLVYMSQSKYQEAEQMFLKSLEIEQQEKLATVDESDLATSYSNLASVYHSLNQLHKALKYDLKALRIYQKILPEYDLNMAFIYNNLGNTYSKLGKIEEAERYYKKCLKIKEKTLEPSDLELAQTYKNIGVFYYNNQRNISDSGVYLKKALDIYTSSPEIRSESCSFNYNDKIKQIEYCISQLQTVS